MRTVAGVLIALFVLAAAGLLLVRTQFPALLPGASATASASATQALFAASFPDAQGQAQQLGQWRGQVVVLNFWATWCPPCREEMPELSAFHDKFRAQGVTVLGLSTDDAEKIRQFALEAPTSYPLLAGDFEAMRLAESLGNNQGILPYTVVMRRDGSIAAAYLGRVDMALLERDVRALTNMHKRL